jgi:hypothetical protein
MKYKPIENYNVENAILGHDSLLFHTFTQKAFKNLRFHNI